ncbi:hypothetical protein BD413DRAFT_485624 [Trametes elegans]|nr:hypothetical protein BD413DRAFT_485624 [Trametes elegans]
MYPGDDGPPSPAISPDVELPSPDDAGESEVEAQVEPDSPPMSPAEVTIVVTERTSHSRKKKPGHIKRPPNAFMIYRSELCRKRKINRTVVKDHRQISRIAGELWNKLCVAEREPYHALAEEAKLQHAAKYPDYKYSPVYRRDKPAKRKAKQSQPDKVNRCHEVVRLLQQGFEGEALTRELERLDAASRDRDHYSDASDYDARPRKKAARQRARKASACPRPRKTRKTKAKDDDEYVPTEHERTPTRDSSVKAGRPTPLFSQPGSCPADAPDAFVPTSEIPPLDLGESCMNEEVRASYCCFRPCFH